MMHIIVLRKQSTFVSKAFISGIKIICLFSAIVELLPFANDNLSAPLLVAVLSKALLHKSIKFGLIG